MSLFYIMEQSLFHVMSKYFMQRFAQAQRSSDDHGLKKEFWMPVSQAEVCRGLGNAVVENMGISGS